MTRSIRTAWLIAGLLMGCDNTPAIDAAMMFDGGTSAIDASALTDVLTADASSPTRANDPPVAHGETFYTTVGAALTTTDVRVNDTDADGDALTVAGTTMPTHGVVTAMGSGVFHYQPAAGFNGEDDFAYTVDDGHGGTDTAAVHVHVARTLYYVSPTGIDTAAGTSPATAWQTPARVQTALYGGAVLPGDAVLFARDSTFRLSATLNLNVAGEAGRPVVFGAYGAGASPVLSGSRLVSGWTRHAGNIYSARVSGDVAQVYVSGARQTPARYPNMGYLRNDSGSRTRINDSALTQAAGAFDGAILRVRSISWLYNIRRITTYTPGRLNWTQPLSNDIASDDWGYYLDGLLSLLDAEGEWFHDRTAGVLYIWAPGGVDPSSLQVEATQSVSSGSSPTTGVTLSRNYQVLDGLTLQHFVGVETAASSATVPQLTGSALTISYLTHDVAVRNAVVRDSYQGVRIYADDVALEDDLFEDTLATAVQGGGARIRVERCIFRDVATVPGYGEDEWGYFGIRLGGTNITIRHNDLDGVGYVGISVAGSRTGFQTYDLAIDSIIEENVVRHPVAILNDGGAITFDSVDRLQVTRNLALDGAGNLDSQTTNSVSYPTRQLGFGIYFGNTAISNVTLEGNTSARNANGVFVDHTERSHGNVIRGNTFFDNATQVTFSDQSSSIDRTGAGACVSTYDEELVDNLLFSEDAAQVPLHIDDVSCGAPVVWGTFDRNRYYAPLATDVVTHRCFRATCTTHFTLPEWQTASGIDGASTAFGLAWRPSATVHAELFYNPYPSPRVVTFAGARTTTEAVPVTSPLTLAPYTSMVLLP